MVHFIHYILTVIGIGYLITQSELLKPFRMRFSALAQIHPSWLLDKIEGVMNCIYCASFWIGLVVYIFTYEDLSLHAVFSAFSCMGTLYVIHNIFNKK